jgi:GNAT superfamily N-acetyltransferase
MHDRGPDRTVSAPHRPTREVAVETARVGEADDLSALCHRSKQHWAYDDAFMELSEGALTVRADAIVAGNVLVARAADGPGTVLGVAELGPVVDCVIDLDKLFVDPPAIGHGVGAALFRHAVAAARQRGARRMTILADPNAAAFYERMGARFLHTAPSDAIPGRVLPLYVLDLEGGG